MGFNNSKGNSKVECPLRNDGETLQGACVTVKQEERGGSSKRMNRKKGKRKKSMTVHTAQL